jgi:hypothetical protein
VTRLPHRAGAEFLTRAGPGASNLAVQIERSSGALCSLAALWLCAQGCAFPIIDFEDHSAPRHIAYQHAREHYAADAYAARASLQPSAANPEAASSEPRQDRARPSVMAPLLPAPEPSTPAQLEACHEALARAGVHFETLSERAAPGVQWPIRLRGPVGGVSFEPLDGNATHAILDCRLGLALVRWSKDLRRAGVRRVDHYSMYRPFARIGGDGAVSGHAHGMAIDAARFTLDNGIAVDVLDDWEGRKRGQAPCPLRRDESRGSRLLRGITCAAVDEKLFEVVLTPHYNKAHENHVHLECKPEVSWTYVR